MLCGGREGLIYNLPIGENNGLYGYYGNDLHDLHSQTWCAPSDVGVGKPVILVHVDASNDSNLMLHSSSTTNIYLSDLATYDFERLPECKYMGAMK